jgi:hypothetical protein
MISRSLRPLTPALQKRVVEVSGSMKRGPAAPGLLMAENVKKINIGVD